MGARRRGVATPSATIRSAITGGTIEDVEVSAPCLNVAWAGACERCYCCPRACRVCQLAFRRTSSIPLQNFVGHTVAVNDDCTVQTVAYTSSLFTGSSGATTRAMSLSGVGPFSAVYATNYLVPLTTYGATTLITKMVAAGLLAHVGGVYPDGLPANVGGPSTGRAGASHPARNAGV